MELENRFLELMMQQTAAIERLCTMQLVMVQHMQHLLMLQDVMPQKLILPDTCTHPLFHAFEEIDVSMIRPCPEGEKAGHVYLLVAENGWCKIGMSRNVKVRVKHLKIQLPFRTKLLHVIPTDDVIRAERKLHDVFDDCRLVPGSGIINNQGKRENVFGFRPITAIGTEWFRLSAHAVEWIKMIQHMIFPDKDHWDNFEWNPTTIPEPRLDEGSDAPAYRFSHYGLMNWKRRRIELLDEYDVDQFWAQFVSPPPQQHTKQTPPQQSEGVDEQSGDDPKPISPAGRGRRVRALDTSELNRFPLMKLETPQG